MAGSTDELAAAVRAVAEALTEVGGLAEQLSSQATELAEEAAGHGWHGMSSRMQEAAEALDSTAGQLETSRQSCENAAGELGSVHEKIPAAEVTARLTASTTQLGEAVTAFMKAIVGGIPVEEVLPTAIAIRVPFILAGHLLVQFQEPQEQWFDYLDRVWETIEERQ